MLTNQLHLPVDSSQPQFVKELFLIKNAKIQRFRFFKNSFRKNIILT